MRDRALAESEPPGLPLFDDLLLFLAPKLDQTAAGRQQSALGGLNESWGPLGRVELEVELQFRRLSEREFQTVLG